MKKILAGTLAGVLSLGLCLAGFAGCGGGRKDDELVLWAGGQWQGEYAEGLENFIDYYNENYADELGFTVDVDITSSLEVKLSTSLSTNTGPDLVLWDRFYTPTYVEEDMLEPLDALITADSVDTSVWYDVAYGELTYKGSQYGLPVDVDVWGIYLNTDLVDAYNKSVTNEADKLVYDPENWTWDTLYDFADKLTVTSGNGDITQAGYSAENLYEHFFKYLASTGIEMFGSDGYSNFDNQQTRDTVEFFRTLYNAGISRSGLDNDISFAGNMLGMINQPTYFAAYLEKYTPDLNYLFLPQPAYPEEGGENCGMIGGFGLVIPRPAEQYRDEEWEQRKEMAWEFMKWWVCNEGVMLEWTKSTGTVAAYEAVTDSDYVQGNQMLKTAASYIDNYKARPQIPGYQTLEVNVFSPNIEKYMKYPNNAQYTTDWLIETLSSEVDAIIDRYNGN